MFPRRIQTLIHFTVLFLATACILFTGSTFAEDRAVIQTQEIISADELRKMGLENQSFILFDARNKKSYDLAHIEGAILPLSHEFYKEGDLFAARLIAKPPDADAALKESMKSYPKDEPIVTYCNQNCVASVNLLKQLKKHGFTDVRAMTEGIETWMDKGYPIVIGAPRLSSDALQE